MNWDSEEWMAEDVEEHPEMYEALADSKTKTESYCTICGEAKDDYYDVVSHVFTNHDVCGTPARAHVASREVLEEDDDG